MRASIIKQKNLDSILEYIHHASSIGCNVVTFPEYMMFYAGRRTSRQIAADSETMKGGFVTQISKEAKRNKIHVIGTMYEKSKRNDRSYDTAFHINSSGNIVETYRKTHLYDALGVTESNSLIRGLHIRKPKQTPAGKIGMQICYDLRFPEISRILALAGSDILVAPSAWLKGTAKEDQWIALNKTRAIENGCYVIAPAHVGNIYCGRSLAIDPTGKILVDMKKRQGIATVKISASVLRKVRQQMPLLASRRTDIYSRF